MVSGHRCDRYLSSKRGQGFTIVELLIVVVVIAILAAISLVAYNGITNQARDSVKVSEIAQWKKKSEIRKAEKGISCPENYAFVYGNSALGTDDFCVMKYEAKNVGGVATSQASGTPWVNISQTDAITAATASGGHLITDAEWMTIAGDVLSVKYNWSGGEVGSGYIYQGHVNSNPASALAASPDDSDGLNGITGGTGSTVGTNSKRTLLLSSGDTIWDFSGNVYEWTAPAQTISQIGISGGGPNLYEWTAGLLNLGNLPATSRPGALASYTNPITGESLSDIPGWNATKGVGRIYTDYADTGSRAFIRGGRWNSTSSAGVLSLDVYLMVPSDADVRVGFRVAR